MDNTKDSQPPANPPFAAPAGSATGEPRVKTLLRSMIAALDRDDADTYWATFWMFLGLHEEMMKSPNDPSSATTPSKT